MLRINFIKISHSSCWIRYSLWYHYFFCHHRHSSTVCWLVIWINIHIPFHQFICFLFSLINLRGLSGRLNSWNSWYCANTCDLSTNMDIYWLRALNWVLRILLCCAVIKVILLYLFLIDFDSVFYFWLLARILIIVVALSTFRAIIDLHSLESISLWILHFKFLVLVI